MTTFKEGLPIPTADEIRHRRDRYLQESDLHMMRDFWEKHSDLEKEELRTYRQALRDIPEQEGFPTEIVWPTRPEHFGPNTLERPEYWPDEWN